MGTKEEYWSISSSVKKKKRREEDIEEGVFIDRRSASRRLDSYNITINTA